MRPAMEKRVAVVLAIFLLTNVVDGKSFTRCQLAKELVLKHNFPRTFLTNWICLIENESERNTAKVVAKSNGSSSYGLFQINSKKWCKIGKKGGMCNIACEDLLNDDIKDDCQCALKIFDSEGFKSWSGWMRRCKGGPLPDITNCPDLTPPPSRKISETENYRVSPPKSYRSPSIPIFG